MPIIYDIEVSVPDCYIYELVDPRTDAVRYVGSTLRISARYDGHRQGRLPSTAEWIKEVADSGNEVIMRVVEKVPEPTRSRAEQARINQHTGLLNRVNAICDRKPSARYSLDELIQARDDLLAEKANSPDVNELTTALWCVEWHIKQRTASKGNPGRPKPVCVCGDYMSEHLEGKCPHCPCDLRSGQGGGQDGEPRREQIVLHLADGSQTKMEAMSGIGGGKSKGEA